MRALPIAVLGIAAYAVFLVATTPARYLAARLEGAAPGRYEVREAEGSLWNGNARAVVQAPGGGVVIDRVRWTFLPARLASGRLAFAIEARGTGLEASYEASRGVSGWGVRNLTASLDAALAAAALPWLAPWRPEGTLSARTASLEVRGKELHGTLALDWKGAAVAMSPVKPLGAWRAEVSAGGGPAKVTVTTLEGPLRVAGQGTLELPARLAFAGEARAEGPQAGALAPLLDLLGPARADGSRALDWRSR